MDTPAISSETAGRAQPGSSGLLASLSSALSHGVDTNSLFENTLAQTNTIPQAPSTPVVPTQNANANTNAAQNQSNAENEDNISDENNVTAPSSSATNPSVSFLQTKTPRVLRHNCEGHSKDGHKDKDSKNRQETADKNSTSTGQAPVTANSSPQATTQTAAPSVTTSAVTEVADDNKVNSTDQSTDQNSTLPTQPANPAVPAAPDATSATNDTGSSKDADPDATSVDGTSTKNAPFAAWQMLLTKLGRLVSSQNGIQDPASLGTDITAQSTAAGASAPSLGSANASKGKADLKELLPDLVDQNIYGDASAKADADPQTAASQNDPATQTSTDASGANSTKTNNASASTDSGKDAWMNADYFNLFNAPSNSSSNTPASSAVAGQGTGLSALETADDGSKTDTSADDGRDASSLSRGMSQNLGSETTPLAANSSAANPYDFANQLSAAREAKAAPTMLSLPAEQVILQIARSVKDGSSQMSIQLKPDDLGHVDVKLNISSDGKVQGSVVASNPATLDLLLKDVRGLERALQEAGLRADPGSLQFSLSNGQSNSSSGQQMTGGNPTYVPASSQSNSDIGDVSVSNTTETYYMAPGRVNLRV